MTESGSEAFRLAGRGDAAVGVQGEFFDDDALRAELLDRAHPFDLGAFGESRLGFLGMGLEMGRVRDIDEDGFGGAEAKRGPGGVHGDIAAADHRDHPAENRRLAALDVAEQADGVDQLLAVHRRNVEVVGDLRAHGHENRVESAFLLRRDDVIDLLAAF